MRVLLHFAWKLLAVNLPASVLAAAFLRGVAATAFSQPFVVSAALRDTGTAGLTVGFGLSVYVYLLVRRHEIPLYLNHGLRLPVCVAFSYVVHLLVFVPFLAVGYAVSAAS
jgi:hypothetical protein